MVLAIEKVVKMAFPIVGWMAHQLPWVDWMGLGINQESD